MRIFWFVEGEIIGQSTRFVAASEHFMCPVCGRVWAQILCDGDSEHFPMRVACPDHESEPAAFNRAVLSSHFHPVCSSMDAWTTIVPKEVLVRDFLHLYANQEHN